MLSPKKLRGSLMGTEHVDGQVGAKVSPLSRSTLTPCSFPNPKDTAGIAHRFQSFLLVWEVHKLKHAKINRMKMS